MPVKVLHIIFPVRLILLLCLFFLPLLQTLTHLNQVIDEDELSSTSASCIVGRGDSQFYSAMPSPAVLFRHSPMHETSTGIVLRTRRVGWVKIRLTNCAKHLTCCLIYLVERTVLALLFFLTNRLLFSLLS